VRTTVRARPRETLALADLARRARAAIGDFCPGMRDDVRRPESRAVATTCVGRRVVRRPESRAVAIDSRARARDPRLRLVIKRFATYAGADPRRAPAALAVAGYVELAFGAWHVRGGPYRLVEVLVARLARLGVSSRFGEQVAGSCDRAGG
jgi:phytoene dehydrogenase-like protein